MTLGGLKGLKISALTLEIDPATGWRRGQETNLLCISFETGQVLSIWDDGQTCCEHRHMATDDDLTQFAGAAFLGCELRDASVKDDDYGVTETQFLVVLTDKGNVSFANYNEHNGYYGGFEISASLDGERLCILEEGL